MAQKRYVRACSMVSFRYLHRKNELHPGMVMPGCNFFFITASAIFMKNWAISERDKLIFFPCSCSSWSTPRGMVWAQGSGGAGEVREWAAGR
jgi:hypothetical protein